MQRLSVVVRPSSAGTRVLAVQGGEVILKGRLLPSPSHPRALRWLLEAVALWQGQRVAAALCAGERGSLSPRLFEADWFTDFGGPLYELRLVDEGAHRPVLVDPVRGLGEFRELKEVVRAQVCGEPQSHGARRSGW